jgi:hypothetical protein
LRPISILCDSPLSLGIVINIIFSNYIDNHGQNYVNSFSNLKLHSAPNRVTQYLQLSDLKIKWQIASDATWAFDCDFHGKDVDSVRVQGEECAPSCQARPDCTHFTWSSYEGGTCWMKSGRVRKEEAVTSQDVTGNVCGILNDGT